MSRAICNEHVRRALKVLPHSGVAVELVRVWGNVHSLCRFAGGYFSTTGDDPSIRLRIKEDQDGAEPAATSIAIANLMRLATMAPAEQAARLSSRAAQAAASFGRRLEHAPVALTQMCCSLHLVAAGMCPSSTGFAERVHKF